MKVLDHFTDVLSLEIQSVAMDINFLKDAGFLNMSIRRGAMRVELSEPSSFDGFRNTKTLENFL